MQLKLVEELAELTSNRTIKELKYSCNDCNSSGEAASNRTIKELKCMRDIDANRSEFAIQSHH